MNHLSRMLAEVGAEREGVRPASGTVTPAKHPASTEPSQAGSPARLPAPQAHPGRPLSLGAGRQTSMGKGAGRREGPEMYFWESQKRGGK